MLLEKGVPPQGCSPKKEVGGRLKQDLDKDFLKQFRPTYRYTHTRQKNSAVLKFSYTAFR